MNKEHINDFDIQRFALREENFERAAAEHIKSCEYCSRKAEQYKLLFESIRRQEKPEFNFDLAGAVIEKLPQKKSAQSFEKLLAYFFIIIAAVSISAFLYFYGKGLRDLFEKMEPLLIAIIIVSFVILGLFLAVDTYRKYKERMKTLNFY